PKEGIVIVFKHRFKRLALNYRRVLGRQFRHPIEHEKELRLKRLLAPKSAIVVKRGDALSRRHEIRFSLIGYARDKVENGGFGCAIVPGGKRLRVCQCYLHAK